MSNLCGIDNRGIGIATSKQGTVNFIFEIRSDHAKRFAKGRLHFLFERTHTNGAFVHSAAIAVDEIQSKSAEMLVNKTQDARRAAHNRKLINWIIRASTRQLSSSGRIRDMPHRLESVHCLCSQPSCIVSSCTLA